MSGKTQVLIEQITHEIHKGNQKIAVCYWDVLPARIFLPLSKLPGVRSIGDKEIRYLNGSVVKFVSQADTYKTEERAALKWVDFN